MEGTRNGKFLPIAVIRLLIMKQALSSNIFTTKVTGKSPSDKIQSIYSNSISKEGIVSTSTECLETSARSGAGA